MTKDFQIPAYHVSYEPTELSRARQGLVRDEFYAKLEEIMSEKGISGIKLDKHGIIVPLKDGDLEIKVIFKQERVDISGVLEDTARKEQEKMEKEAKKQKKIKKDKERRSKLTD